MVKIHLAILTLFLAGLSGCTASPPSLTIVLENPLDIPRANETIAIATTDILQRLPGCDLKSLVVRPTGSQQTLVSQLVDNNLDGDFDQLLFQTDFAASERKSMVVKEDKTADRPSEIPAAYARFVPERKDDFAWENDRIAYRMYGPALEADGQVSSGVDVWVKRVRGLVIDKWYQPGYDYHTDHGEGLDCYDVGATLGCGGLAPWDGEHLTPSRNFTGWKIVANGPIRTTFELTYAPWEFENGNVSEVKRISLDAGHHLSRFESRFDFQKDGSVFDCAIGIAKRKGGGEVRYDSDNGWLAYWQPEQPDNGTIGCAILVDPARFMEAVESDEHHLVIALGESDQPAIHYAGAGWSKSGEFANSEDWFDYVESFALRLQSPIRIQLH